MIDIMRAKRRIVPVGMAACMSLFLTACACTRAGTHQASKRPIMHEPSGAALPENKAAETVIPLHEESLSVGKQEMDEGEVRLHKVVTTEKKNMPVDLKEESLEIIREPAGAAHPGAIDATKELNGKDVVIQLKEEEPVLQRTEKETGDILIKKNTHFVHRDITGDAKKEDIQVDRSNPNVHVNYKGGTIHEAAGAQAIPADKTDKKKNPPPPKSDQMDGMDEY